MTIGRLNFGDYQIGIPGNSMVRQNGKNPEPGPHDKVTHKVKSQEGLLKIARDHNMTLEMLFAANPELNKNSVLSIGQEINLYYVVKSGETPTGIAKKFGVTVQQLYNYLGITQASELKKDMVINLDGLKKKYPTNADTKPSDQKKDEPPKTPDKTDKPTPQQPANPPSSSSSATATSNTSTNGSGNTTGPTHKVVKGNTLSTIAKTYFKSEARVQLLKDCNPDLKNDNLSLNQEIKLYYIVKKDETISSISEKYDIDEADLRKFLKADIKENTVIDFKAFFEAYPKTFNNCLIEGKGYRKIPTGQLAVNYKKYHHDGDKCDYYLDNKAFQSKGLADAKVGGDYRNKNVVKGLTRPEGNVVNGVVEATVTLADPTKKNPKGPLAGHVVILNSGHGGYQDSDCAFDPGVVTTVKQGDGTYEAIEEWQYAQKYINDLTTQLQKDGADVIIVQGAVRNGGMAQQKYLENLLKGLKGPEEVRTLIKNTPQSEMCFMSIHLNSAEPNKTACKVIGQNEDAGDEAFANLVSSELAGNSFQPVSESGNLYVTRAMSSNIPAVLVEVGNINNKDIQNYIKKDKNIHDYNACLVRAIEKTLIPPKTNAK